MIDVSSYGFNIIARAPKVEDQLFDGRNIDHALILAKRAGFNVKPISDDLDEGLEPVSGVIGLLVYDHRDFVVFKPYVRCGNILNSVCYVQCMKDKATFDNVTKLLQDSLSIAKDYAQLTRNAQSIVLGRSAVFRRDNQGTNFSIKYDDLIVSISPKAELFEVFVDFHHNGGRGSTIEMASSSKPPDQRTAYKPDIAKALFIECFNDIDTERIALRTGGYYSKSIAVFERLKKAISQ